MISIKTVNLIYQEINQNLFKKLKIYKNNNINKIQTEKIYNNINMILRKQVNEKIGLFKKINYSK